MQIVGYQYIISAGALFPSFHRRQRPSLLWTQPGNLSKTMPILVKGEKVIEILLHLIILNNMILDASLFV